MEENNTKTYIVGKTYFVRHEIVTFTEDQLKNADFTGFPSEIGNLIKANSALGCYTIGDNNKLWQSMFLEGTAMYAFLEDFINYLNPTGDEIDDKGLWNYIQTLFMDNTIVGDTELWRDKLDVFDKYMKRTSKG